MKYKPRGTVKKKSYVYAQLCSVGRIKNQQITLSYRFDKNNTTDIHLTYNGPVRWSELWLKLAEKHCFG